jgi:hypothetical protein
LNLFFTTIAKFISAERHFQRFVKENMGIPSSIQSINYELSLIALQNQSSDFTSEESLDLLTAGFPLIATSPNKLTAALTD